MDIIDIAIARKYNKNNSSNSSSSSSSSSSPVSSSKIELYDSDEEMYLQVRDFKEKAQTEGWIITYKGDGETKDYFLPIKIDSKDDIIVKINDVVTDDFSFTRYSYDPRVTDFISFTSAPNKDEKITIEFISTSLQDAIPTYTFGTRSHNSSIGSVSASFGMDNIAAGECSFAEGQETAAKGVYSHAEGYNTTAFGNYSHAEGANTFADGDCTHAEGYNTIARGIYSHAEGYNTIARGVYSHASGYNTIANGSYSYTEGYNTHTEVPYTHAEGKDTIAAGIYSHVEGYNTQTNGSCSHAEGYKAIANGDYSHVEGYNTQTNSPCSHAEGYNTIAKGVYSHASGYNTIANGEASAAFGKNNLSFKTENNNTINYLFTIGNGTENNRNNAFAIDYDGNVEIEGNITSPTITNLLNTISNTSYPLIQCGSIEDETNSYEYLSSIYYSDNTTMRPMPVLVASGDRLFLGTLRKQQYYDYEDEPLGYLFVIEWIQTKYSVDSDKFVGVCYNYRYDNNYTGQKWSYNDSNFISIEEKIRSIININYDSSSHSFTCNDSDLWQTLRNKYYSNSQHTIAVYVNNIFVPIVSFVPVSSSNDSHKICFLYTGKEDLNKLLYVTMSINFNGNKTFDIKTIELNSLTS